jgi:hypothetical protein
MSKPTKIVDYLEIDWPVDHLAVTYGHPHFDHGCKCKPFIRPDGLVYCEDCGAQIGSVPVK